MTTAGLDIYTSDEEVQKARYKEAAKATYTERFYMLMKLIKVSRMINNANIISPAKWICCMRIYFPTPAQFLSLFGYSAWRPVGSAMLLPVIKLA